jgi:RNA polymerase sigma factor (sigma-70 family)
MTTRRFTLDEQKTLVARAQDGDGDAASALVENTMPFLRNLAGQTARRTGAYKVEEDMFQEACLALFERIQHYDLSSSARLEFYAYPWIMARVKELACESLEIVRLPRDAHAHAAHREIELGHDPDVVAAKHNLSKDAVAALTRHTVDLAAYQHDDVIQGVDVEPDQETCDEAWCRLSAHHRRVLSCCMEHQSVATRLSVWRWMRWLSAPINAYDLQLLERQAKQRLCQLIGEIEGPSDGA